MSLVDVAADLYLLLAALGLAVSVSYAGLPVLGQGAFVAVGGFGTLLLGPGHVGLPLVPAAAVAVASAGGLGWLVGFGATRLQGAPLALATWGFAWLVDRVLVAFPVVSGGSQGVTAPIPARLVSPSLGLTLTLSPRVHVALAAALCLLTVLALVRAGRGPAGLDLAALREGPVLAESLGVPVAARRRAVLATSAAVGGISGAGTAVLLGLVAPADVAPLLSLQLFVAVLLGGTATWWGPVLGVAVLVALPRGADAVAAAGGLPAERARGALTAGLLVLALALRPVLGRIRRRHRAPLAGSEPSVASGQQAIPHQTGGPSSNGVPHRPGIPHRVVLAASHLTAGYAGPPVLDDVGLVLRAGDVHALVGPNGSGKSTLLRVLAGALPATSGCVRVAGRTVGSRGGPAARVPLGVARTFQRTTVLPGVPVARQVEVGARGGAARPFAALRHLLASPSSRSEAHVRSTLVDAALADTGLAARAPDRPAVLTTGERRLLQVARAAATGAAVLLLDEPAAGMSADERRHLATALRRLAGNGTAVLLVEHDMRLVGAVADRVTVLAAGRVLARGTPERIRRDAAVQRAYLGAATATPTPEPAADLEPDPDPEPVRQEHP